jgi:hypothetical protein
MRWLILVLGFLFVTTVAQAQSVQPWVNGSASTTGGTITTIIAAPGTPGSPTGLPSIEVTGVQCGRTDTGTTAIYVTFNDVNATILVLPNSGGGGGNNAVFTSPITAGPGIKFAFTSSASTSTVYCNAQGFLR